jgi:IclR family pca regulon transcriptional regulator
MAGRVSGGPGVDPPDNPRDVVQSLERGLAVILAFSDHGPELSLQQLAELTGLSRPAVRRILITLRGLGYVRSDGPRYSLTSRVLRLGYAYLSSQRLQDVAQPHLESFVGEVRESCSLGSLDGTDVMVVARVPARRIMAITMAVGTRLPAHASALGRVLLAGLDAGALDAWCAGAVLDPLTPRTVTTEAALRRELARARERGHVILDQELEEGVRTVAAPVRDAAGRVPYAVACSVHAGLVDEARLRREHLPALLATAENISKEMAHLGR